MSGCAARGSAYHSGLVVGGYCERHYRQLKRLGRLIPPSEDRVQRGKYKTCTVDGCGEAHRAKGLCVRHYNDRLRVMAMLTTTRRRALGPSRWNLKAHARSVRAHELERVLYDLSAALEAACAAGVEPLLS